MENGLRREEGVLVCRRSSRVEASEKKKGSGESTCRFRFLSRPIHHCLYFSLSPRHTSSFDTRECLPPGEARFPNSELTSRNEHSSSTACSFQTAKTETEPEVSFSFAPSTHACLGDSLPKGSAPSRHFLSRPPSRSRPLPFASLTGRGLSGMRK